MKVLQKRKLNTLWAGPAVVVFSFCWAAPGVWAAGNDDLTTLVPQEAIFFVSHQRVGNPGEKPEYPNFKSSLKAWFESMDDILEWRIAHEELKRMGWLGGDEEKSGFWETMAGDSAAVAVFLPTFSEGAGFPTVLYMAKSKEPKKLEDTLIQSLEKLGGMGLSVELNAGFYEDVPVTSLYIADLRLPGTYAATACLDDVFLFSTSAGTIERVIDVVKFDAPQLNETDVYKRVFSHLPKDHDRLSYVNMERINAVLEDAIDQIAKGVGMEMKPEQAQSIKDGLKNLRPYLEGIAGSGSVARWTKDGRAVEHYIAFAENAIQYPYGEMLAGEPLKPIPLKYVPRRTQTFSHGNIVSVENAWKTFLSISESIPGIEPEALRKPIAEIETQIGLSVEGDILPWLGDEVAVIQSAPSRDAIIPVKHMAVFLSLKDEDLAKDFIDRLVVILQDHFKLKYPPVVSSYRDVELISYEIPVPGVPYSPTLGITEGYLVAASSQDYFMELLDVRNDEGTNLTETGNYESLESIYDYKNARAISYNNLARSFLDAKESLERIQAIGGLAGMAQSLEHAHSTGKQYPEEIITLVKTGVGRLSQLFQILSVYRAEGGRVETVDGGLLVSGLMTMRDLPRPTVLDVRSRGKCSFFADKYLVPFARDLSKNKDVPFANDISMYLLSLASRYIPEQKADAQTTIAQLLFQQGKTEEAFNAIESALEGERSNETLITAIEMIQQKSHEDAQAFLRSRADHMECCDLAYVLFRVAEKSNPAEKEQWLKTAIEIGSEESPWTKTAAAELAIAQHQKPDGLPSITVPTYTDAPVIDGELDDPIWQQSPVIENLHLFGNGEPDSGRSTRVMIVAGTDALYFGFECGEPELQKLQATQSGSDRTLDKDDSVTVWLSPKRTYDSFYEFANNPGDGSLDAQGRYTGFEKNDTANARREYNLRFWDAPWQRATGRSGNGWTAEFAIPYKSIEAERPQQGTVWGLNLSRSAATVSPPQIQAWSLAGDTISHPRSYGYLWFE